MLLGTWDPLTGRTLMLMTTQRFPCVGCVASRRPFPCRWLPVEMALVVKVAMIISWKVGAAGRKETSRYLGGGFQVCFFFSPIWGKFLF